MNSGCAVRGRRGIEANADEYVLHALEAPGEQALACLQTRNPTSTFLGLRDTCRRIVDGSCQQGGEVEEERSDFKLTNLTSSDRTGMSPPIIAALRSSFVDASDTFDLP